ncbi:hypothetical protein D915_011011 [Fasciola hepatica]|uniref:Uncharacterized protein n=1 Tax=Fasciola hepatica TaxID=6192 RepID=A0A4E0RUR8_FASHE|nr:hypothetical protein D915_011011 [Fasciola hepatica]
MISSCFVTAIQVLILFTLSSPCVRASTFTGSMFEVQISTKLPVKDWVKEAKKDSDPFSLWDPTCFKFVSAIKSVDNQLKEALYTCHSVPGGDENTRLKIYLFIPPERLAPEKQEPCLRAAYKKAFDDWKAGVSANFQIRPEQVQFSCELSV